MGRGHQTDRQTNTRTSRLLDRKWPKDEALEEDPCSGPYYLVIFNFKPNVKSRDHKTSKQKLLQKFGFFCFWKHERNLKTSSFKKQKNCPTGFLCNV